MAHDHFGVDRRLWKDEGNIWVEMKAGFPEFIYTDLHSAWIFCDRKKRRVAQLINIRGDVC